MKKNIIILGVLILIISCKGNFTNVKVSTFDNNEKYQCFIYNGEKPDYQEPLDTIYIYKPFSFNLNNNTGSDLIITSISDNLHAGGFKPYIIQDQYYQYLSSPLLLSSDDNVNITLFLHLPIPLNKLNKVYSDRLLVAYSDGKYDSILVNKIDEKLQKDIDFLLKKKEVIIHYHERKDIKKKAMLIYCVDKHKLGVFRSDSLAKLKTTFRYNCD